MNTMPPTPIDTPALNPEARGLLDGLHFNPGEASNFLHILAKSMAAMRAYCEAENALAGGELTAGEREQIALAVAEINGSKYCLRQHAAAARKAGLSEADIRLAGRATATDARARAMLAFVLAVVLQRGEIKPDDLKALRKTGFTESEIIEVVANIAMNIFTNYLNLISKTEADAAWPQPGAEAPGLAGTFAGKES